MFWNRSDGMYQAKKVRRSGLILWGQAGMFWQSCRQGMEYRCRLSSASDNCQYCWTVCAI